MVRAGDDVTQQQTAANSQLECLCGSPCTLKGSLIIGCYVGQAEAVDDRLRHLLEADLDMLAIKVKGFLHPDTYISEAQLGRFIKNMPLFQHAAPASAMLLPPTAEQLKAFIDSLMLSQQQSGSDWVDRLGPMEWEIRRRRSHSKPSASDRYYAPSAPRSTFVYLKEEGKVHLAVGFILRGLLSAGMLKQYFRDTRRGGIMGSPHAPNFTGFVTPAEAWSSVVSHPTHPHCVQPTS